MGGTCGTVDRVPPKERRIVCPKPEPREPEPEPETLDDIVILPPAETLVKPSGKYCNEVYPEKVDGELYKCDRDADHSRSTPHKHSGLKNGRYVCLMWGDLPKGAK